jgi:uncharacterized protein (DUF2141 family)
MQFPITKMITVILLTSTLTAGSMAGEPVGSINLTISNIRNDKGQILISLFNQPVGFPSDSTRAYRTYVIDAEERSISLRIENLHPGEYAIALIHDENQNLKLDTNLVGAPVEGYAASGANKRFSSPKFESSKFMLKNESLNLEIVMNYLF